MMNTRLRRVFTSKVAKFHELSLVGSYPALRPIMADDSRVNPRAASKKIRY